MDSITLMTMFVVLNMPCRTKIRRTKLTKFDLVMKILSNNKFCPIKISSNMIVQNPVTNRAKSTNKFRNDEENFVQRKILSGENFDRQIFVR